MAGTERQQEAITCHNTSVVVSAGAGTGKTFVLVNKYMDLLECFGSKNTDTDSQISVLNILALTFTDKAAAEMKERIRSELEERHGEFWEKTRQEFLIAPVQTFHSFCASVLREFPFEAGLEPSFVVLDQQEALRILSLSFQDLIHTPVEGDEYEALIGTLSLVSDKTLEKMIRYLYFRSDEAELFFSHLEQDKDLIIFRWQKEIQKFRESEVKNLQKDPKFVDIVISLLAFASMDIPSDDKAMIYLQEVKPDLETLLDTESVDEFLRASQSFTKITLRGGTTKNWSPDILQELRVTNKSLNEWLKKESYAISKVQYQPDSPFSKLTIRFLSHLCMVFRRFCEIVERKKSESGGLDFTDLIRYTKKLFLTNREFVASYYADRYRYILIDEFQDTDQVQFDIVKTIIGEPTPDIHSLFIVGDPKQSIYLFRDADVTRFREAQNLITESCAGKNIPLDVCFRSSPAVVAFVNTLFSRLFRTAEKPWEFPYDAIQVSTERSEHTGSVSCLLIRKDSEIPEPEAVTNQIVKIIQEKWGVYEEGPRDQDGNRTFRVRPAVYGDIAILLERRTNLGLFIHALASRNIPYYVHKGTGFYNRQEILDLISLINVLYRPYDDVSLTGLLRSPYFGLSDLDIVRISREKGQSFLEKLERSRGYSPEFERVYDLISKWQSSAGRMRLVPLIQMIFIDSGVLAVYGGLVEGDQILSNIEKLLDIIRTREEKGRYSLPDLVRDLSDTLEHEEEEGEAMIDISHMNAVILMTVHAAKGLEFPIVIIPEMTTPPNLTQGPLLMDSNRDLIGLSLPDPDHDLETTKTPVYLLLKKEQDNRLLAEKKRLLYVALTRSADHLIMSGEIGDELPDGTKDTRFGWIFSALEIYEYDINEGKKFFTSDNGEHGEIEIIIPTPDVQESTPEKKPFEIIPELMDCKGKFSKINFDERNHVTIPYLVTKIVENLDTKEGKDYVYENGDGAQYGSAIHEVLRGRNPETIIIEFGIEDEIQQHKLRTVYEEFNSQLNLQEDTEHFHEYAFSMIIGGIPLTGRIDLLLRKKDGSWMVIDHKSAYISPSELKSKESYQFQVEVYRRAAEILGMKPAKGALYSVYENQIIELDSWDDTKFSNYLKIITKNTRSE